MKRSTFNFIEKKVDVGECLTISSAKEGKGTNSLPNYKNTTALKSSRDSENEICPFFDSGIPSACLPFQERDTLRIYQQQQNHNNICLSSKAFSSKVNSCVSQQSWITRYV